MNKNSEVKNIFWGAKAKNVTTVRPMKRLNKKTTF